MENRQRLGLINESAMNSSDNHIAIGQFWSWFEKHKAEIGLLIETSDPLWDRVLSKLQIINKGLWFEMSRPDGNDREFIITAESRTELFKLVETIASQAPELAGWQFVALKPPRGFAFKTNYEGISLNPKSMLFLPLEWSDAPEKVGLRIGVENFSESDRDSITNGVFVILETGLGERTFGADVHHVEVCLLPQESEAEGYFPLSNLTEYISWRKQKLELN